MIEIKRLQAQDVLFFEKLDVDFSNSGDLVLVLGQNEDDPGCSSNMSGKSSLFDLIGICLFKQSAKRLKADELLRIDASGKQAERGFVEIDFSVDGEELSIRQELGKRFDRVGRWVSCPDSNLLVLLNGEDQTRRLETQTREWLFELLDLPASPKEAYEQFRNSTHIARDGAAAFLDKDLTPAKRIELVTKAINLDEFDLYIEKARKVKKESEEELSSIDMSIDFVKPDQEYDESKIPVIEAQILSSQNNLENLTSNLEKINNQLSVLQAKNQSVQALKALEREKESYERQAELLLGRMRDEYERILKEQEEAESCAEKLLSLSPKIQSLDEHLASNRNALKKVDESLARANKDNGEVQAELKAAKEKEVTARRLLEKALSCPRCHALLLLSAQGDSLSPFDENAAQRQLDAAGAKIQELASRATSLRDQSTELARETASLQEEIRNLESQKSSIEREKSSLEAKIQRLPILSKRLDELDKEGETTSQEKESKLLDFSKRIEVAKASISGDVSKALQELESKKRETESSISQTRNSSQTLQQKLTSYKKAKEQIAKLKTQREEVHKKFVYSSYWEKGFSTIKRWKLDAFLPSLETETNKTLEAMQISQRVSFSTLKELKKEDEEGNKLLKAGFEVEISSGEKNYSLRLASAGEAQRLALATAFAFKSLASSQAFGFMLIDEVVDVLDEQGIQCLLEVLKTQPGKTFIVSHKPDLQGLLFDSLLTVTREGNKSTAKMESAA